MRIWEADSAAGYYLESHRLSGEYRDAGRADVCDAFKTCAETHLDRRRIGNKGAKDKEIRIAFRKTDGRYKNPQKKMFWNCNRKNVFDRDSKIGNRRWIIFGRRIWPTEDG